jgi:tetratricopeptide (TPR) repeat protein
MARFSKRRTGPFAFCGERPYFLSSMAMNLSEEAAAARQSGLAALQRGQAREAIPHLEKALELEPDAPDLRNNLGLAYLAEGRAKDAIAEFQRALAANPLLVRAHYNLGNALRSINDSPGALKHLQQAVALAPDFAEAHNNLGIILQGMGRLEQAMAHYQKALELKPDYPEAHNNLATALQASDRLEPALEHLEWALSLRPDYADALTNRGNVLAELGRFEEAIPSYERAVALAPRRMDYHRNLSAYKRYAPGDPHLAMLETLARDLSSLGESDQIDLHFALGKAWDDLGNHRRAFEHLLAGNRLHRSQVDYDESAAMRLFHAMRAVFGKDVVTEFSGSGAVSSAPVFIFGMPRSGTTLVEQILASHPAVFGAGELPFVEQSIVALLGGSLAAERIPEVLLSMKHGDWRDMGEFYLERVSALSPAERITDKMPGNFRFAGPIHLALPGARLIHVRRSPLDTCLSCFAKRFSDHHPYAYDLGELGRYYRAYRELMEHWRRVLPEGVMLEVDYEDVVVDLEGQARRLVAHCGLAWDPSCLAFHQNLRPVRTASAHQVRQPVYRTSVGRGRAYGELLRPLLSALGSGSA